MKIDFLNVKASNLYQNEMKNTKFKPNFTSKFDSFQKECELSQDDKKIAKIAALALGACALAGSVIKCAPKIIQKFSSNSGEITQNLSKGLPEDNPLTTGKIDNPVEFFQEKLKFIFPEKIMNESNDVQFSKISEPEILQNGTKRYFAQINYDGVDHNVKLAVDKDNNFIHIFDKYSTLPNDEYCVPMRCLDKYDINGKQIAFVNETKGNYHTFKAYSAQGAQDVYTKRKYFNTQTGEYTGERVSKGIIKEKILREKHIKKDVFGNDFVISTDYTTEVPTQKIKHPSLRDEIKVFSERGEKDKDSVFVDIFKLDEKGNILSKAEGTIGSIWKDEAVKIDVSADSNGIKLWKPAGINNSPVHAIKKGHVPKDAEDMLEFLKENRDISLKDGTQSIFKDLKDRPYDVSEHFCIMANNSYLKNENALITDEIPEIFKGMKADEIQKAVDNLLLDFNINGSRKQTREFEIAGKKFRAKFVGSGCIGKVYKIEDLTGNSVAIKQFKDPGLLGLQSGYGEIPLSRQLSLDGVIDVPKFYMANPISRWAEKGNIDGFPSGGWMMNDYISADKIAKKDGFTFIKWLKKNGLSFGDYNSGSEKNGYIVDIGGVFNPDKGVPSSDGYDKLIQAYLKNDSIESYISALEEAIARKN